MRSSHNSITSELWHPLKGSYTDRCSGKMERSHRTDEGEFYRRTAIRDRQNLTRKVPEREREYNHLTLTTRVEI